MGCFELGAEANAVDSPGDSALHVAVSRGDAAIAEVLLRRGAVVNARDRVCGGTPLNRAVCLGRRDWCGLLLSAGADVELVDDSRRTCDGWPRVLAVFHDADAAAARWRGLRRAALTAWCVAR